jgi:AcrR family transcriptional regulator
MGVQMAKPSSLDLLWGEPEPPSRGPKPGLSLDGIVAAGIKIADADGLGAVSMQRVASEFGFTTMSLYRYVPGKSELIDLMIDAAVGSPPDLDSIPGGWRPKLSAWAHLTRDVFLRHPWFLEAALTRMMGPNQVGWLESAVAALGGTALRGQELVAAALVVNGHVRSMAPFASDRAAGEQFEAAMGQLFARHSARFPALAAAMRDGAFSATDDVEFEFGLERVLDGIEVLVERRATMP